MCNICIIRQCVMKTVTANVVMNDINATDAVVGAIYGALDVLAIAHEETSKEDTQKLLLELFEQHREKRAKEQNASNTATTH